MAVNSVTTTTATGFTRAPKTYTHAGKKLSLLLVAFAVLLCYYTTNAQEQKPNDPLLKSVMFAFSVKEGSGMMLCDFTAPGKQKLPFSKLQQLQQSDRKLMCNSKPRNESTNCLYGPPPDVKTDCATMRKICEQDLKGKYVRVGGQCN